MNALVGYTKMKNTKLNLMIDVLDNLENFVENELKLDLHVESNHNLS